MHRSSFLVIPVEILHTQRILFNWRITLQTLDGMQVIFCLQIFSKLHEGRMPSLDELMSELNRTLRPGS